MEWAPRGSCAQDIAEFAHARDTRHWTAYTGPIDWGTWTSRVRGCSLPLQGQWTTPPDRATRQSKPKLHIQRCTSGLNGEVDGEWVNSTFWVPSGCNASKPFTDFDHRDVVQCLTRRVLLFEGDSVVRQLFMRAIWYFRQLPIIIEHYSHRDMVYSIHEDSDSLHVLEPSQCMEATHRYRAMEARRLCLRRRRETRCNRLGPVPEMADPLEAPLLKSAHAALVSSRSSAILLFRQYGQGELFDAVLKHAVEHGLQPDAVIGVRNERGARANAVAIEVRYMEAPDSSTREHANLSLGERVETLNLDAMNNGRGAPHYYRRNLLYARWRRENISGAPPEGCSHEYEPKVLLGEGRYGAIRQERFFGHDTELPSGMERHVLASEDVHYQCGFYPMWPNRAVGWKFPMNGDCRDILGVNAIRAILNRVCSKHNEHHSRGVQVQNL